MTLALEPLLEPVFDEDSYGYRPDESAQDAIGVTRQRCWQYDWVIEYDIKGLVERWLTAPLQDKDGTQHLRTVGTPQGGPLSPVLANLFLHYALDHWLRRHHPSVPFCRYGDDGILHCKTETEAKQMLLHLDARLRECGLELHLEKTRIVYCKDANRGGKSEHVQFDFLGYTFRPRTLKNRHGELFTSFAPAMSRSAAKLIRQKVRRWRLHGKGMHSLEALAEIINPTVRGWMGYFCRYHQ